MASSDLLPLVLSPSLDGAAGLCGICHHYMYCPMIDESGGEKLQETKIKHTYNWEVMLPILDSSMLIVAAVPVRVVVLHTHWVLFMADVKPLVVIVIKCA